ncbi:MAG: hypothetical protein ACP5VR_04600 [Acidimicrobiales bacterium]
MSAFRLVLGAIWAVDAALKWLPGPRLPHMSATMGIASGQPGWLKPWPRFWADLQHPRATFFACLVAALEILNAAAVLVGFARKLTYASAAVFSVLVWSAAEGFGRPYASGPSDIGPAVIYPVVFVGLVALSYYAGLFPDSEDCYLERRLSCWWHLAAVRRPERPALLGPRAGTGLVLPALASVSGADEHVRQIST